MKTYRVVPLYDYETGEPGPRVGWRVSEKNGDCWTAVYDDTSKKRCRRELARLRAAVTY